MDSDSTALITQAQQVLASQTWTPTIEFADQMLTATLGILHGDQHALDELSVGTPQFDARVQQLRDVADANDMLLGLFQKRQAGLAACNTLAMARIATEAEIVSLIRKVPTAQGQRGQGLKQFLVAHNIDDAWLYRRTILAEHIDDALEWMRDNIEKIELTTSAVIEYAARALGRKEMPPSEREATHAAPLEMPTVTAPLDYDYDEARERFYRPDERILQVRAVLREISQSAQMAIDRIQAGNSAAAVSFIAQVIGKTNNLIDKLEE